MYSNINEHEFCHEMSSNKDHWFTYEGARILFEYLEELEDGTESTIEFDPIAFRCEFTEYCTGDYINDYHDISENFLGWLLDRETITESESLELAKDNKKKLDANSYDFYTLEWFFEDQLENQDENIIGWESECFIVRTY
jgi:hypothetical protein